MKMEVLKCLIYLTIGAKYLSSPRGLQSNYSRHQRHQAGISISQTTLARDNDLGSRLIGKLVDTNLVILVQE